MLLALPEAVGGVVRVVELALPLGGQRERTLVLGRLVLARVVVVDDGVLRDRVHRHVAQVVAAAVMERCVVVRLRMLLVTLLLLLLLLLVRRRGEVLDVDRRRGQYSQPVAAVLDRLRHHLRVGPNQRYLVLVNRKTY
uniref:Uncharacterized protein n=1 Tax=Anopheles atroparvus TaxID=41427 RepID=A0A182IUQ2_ANOAO